MISQIIEKLAGLVYSVIEFIDNGKDKYYKNDKIRIWYRILQLIFIFNVFIISIPLILLVFILKLFSEESKDDRD